MLYLFQTCHSNPEQILAWRREATEDDNNFFPLMLMKTFLCWGEKLQCCLHLDGRIVRFNESHILVEINMSHLPAVNTNRFPGHNLSVTIPSFHLKMVEK